jgi:FolB domain-containing protein
MRKEPQLIRLDFESSTVDAPRPLSLKSQYWRVFISNLKLKGLIGIYPEEKISPQSILINVNITYRGSVPHGEVSVGQVVCYQQIVKNIEELVSNSHILFVENLAEEIAMLCLEDLRVTEVTVRVEKPDAIKEASSVGVEIVRQRINESITLVN